MILEINRLMREAIELERVEELADMKRFQSHLEKVVNDGLKKQFKNIFNFSRFKEHIRFEDQPASIYPLRTLNYSATLGVHSGPAYYTIHKDKLGYQKNIPLLLAFDLDKALSYCHNPLTRCLSIYSRIEYMESGHVDSYPTGAISHEPYGDTNAPPAIDACSLLKEVKISLEKDICELIKHQNYVDWGFHCYGFSHTDPQFPSCDKNRDDIVWKDNAQYPLGRVKGLIAAIENSLSFGDAWSSVNYLAQLERIQHFFSKDVVQKLTSKFSVAPKH